MDFSTSKEASGTACVGFSLSSVHEGQVIASAIMALSESSRLPQRNDQYVQSAITSSAVSQPMDSLHI
jgi:hypothetical protein